MWTITVVQTTDAAMLDVVRKFNLYNGGGVLPPKWGLGFWHRVPTLFTDNDVLSEVNQFKEKGHFSSGNSWKNLSQLLTKGWIVSFISD